MENTSKSFEQLVEIVKDFRENLVRDFIVGGSLALVMVGGFNLPITDIDIEVEETNINALHGLRFLERASPSECKNYSDGVRIDFIYCGVKFNVFIVPKFTRSFVWKDYVKYGTVMSVINHKKSHNRVKDHQSINIIVRELLTPALLLPITLSA